MKALCATLFATLLFGSLCAAPSDQMGTITRVYTFNSHPEEDVINGKAYEIDGKRLFITEGAPPAYENENPDWEDVQDIIETDVVGFKQGDKIKIFNDPKQTDEIILSAKDTSIHTKKWGTFDQKTIITELKKDQDRSSIVISNGRMLTPTGHSQAHEWKVNAQVKLYKNAKGNFYVCDDASQTCVEMEMGSRWKW